MIITRTPYRFSLMVVVWIILHGINEIHPGYFMQVLITIATKQLRLPPFFNHRYRAAYSKIETTKTIDEIMHPSVREVFRKYGKEASLEVAHVSDLPSRSVSELIGFTVGLTTHSQDYRVNIWEEKN